VRLFDALVREKDMTRFFTLTFDPNDWPSVDSQWEFASWVWSKFRKRLAREFPSCKFIAVLEAHKSGCPHIHGLFSEYVPFDWMQKAWGECNGGVQVRIEKVKTGKISDYLSKDESMAKYLGKQVTDISKYLYRHQRTMWRSVGLKASFESEPEEESEWELLKQPCFKKDGNLLDNTPLDVVNSCPSYDEVDKELEELYGSQDGKG
jgi:hypothetical protein